MGSGPALIDIVIIPFQVNATHRLPRHGRLIDRHLSRPHSGPKYDSRYSQPKSD